MNSVKAKSLGKWLAKQLGAMPGGYEAACSWPNSPMKPDRLAAIGRGERPWPFSEGLMMLALNDRMDLLVSIAQLSMGEAGPGAISKIARKDVYESSDLSRDIEVAEEDGHLSYAEILRIQAGADVNLQNATELHLRAHSLTAGEIED